MVKPYQPPAGAQHALPCLTAPLTPCSASAGAEGCAGLGAGGARGVEHQGAGPGWNGSRHARFGVLSPQAPSRSWVLPSWACCSTRPGAALSRPRTWRRCSWRSCVPWALCLSGWRRRCSQTLWTSSSRRSLCTWRTSPGCTWRPTIGHAQRSHAGAHALSPPFHRWLRARPPSLAAPTARFSSSAAMCASLRRPRRLSCATSATRTWTSASSTPAQVRAAAFHPSVLVQR